MTETKVRCPGCVISAVPETLSLKKLECGERSRWWRFLIGSNGITQGNKRDAY